MKLISRIFTLALIHHVLGKSNFEDCTGENTYGKEYVNFFPVEMGKANSRVQLHIEFYVKSASNAHILLTDRNERNVSSGYEILLGGGGNSFSQIRLIQGVNSKVAKVSKATNGIVSENVYRGFWINLEYHVIITVGKIGSEKPILYVATTKPLRVKYFAFSTWTNVRGKWYFGCSKNHGPEVEEEKKISNVQQLKEDLFNFYNPYNFPMKNDNSASTVEVNFETNYINLNENLGKLSLNGIAYLKWTDWKLTWHPSDYGGINATYVTPQQIWTPPIRIINSIALHKESLLSSRGAVAITNGGEVAWRAPFQSVTFCSLGFINWPFDIHKCSILLGFLTEPMEIEIKSMVLSNISNSVWEIRKMEADDVSTLDDIHGVRVIQIDFQRRNPSLELLLLPPLLSAAVLSFISFWIYPESLAKLFLNCASILILALMLINLIDRIPLISPIPKIVLLCTWGILIMCVPIILFIGLKYLPDNLQLPRVLSAFQESILAKILFCFPEYPKIYPYYRNTMENSINTVRLTMIVERFVFFVYFLITMIPYALYFIKCEILS